MSILSANATGFCGLAPGMLLQELATQTKRPPECEEDRHVK